MVHVSSVTWAGPEEGALNLELMSLGKVPLFAKGHKLLRVNIFGAWERVSELQ